MSPTCCPESRKRSRRRHQLVQVPKQAGVTLVRPARAKNVAGHLAKIGETPAWRSRRNWVVPVSASETTRTERPLRSHLCKAREVGRGSQVLARRQAIAMRVIGPEIRSADRHSGDPRAARHSSPMKEGPAPSPTADTWSLPRRPCRHEHARQSIESWRYRIALCSRSDRPPGPSVKLRARQGATRARPRESGCAITCSVSSQSVANRRERS